MVTAISFLLLTSYLIITSAVGNIIGHICCNVLKHYLGEKFDSSSDSNIPEKIICLDLSSNKILSHSGFDESTPENDVEWHEESSGLHDMDNWEPQSGEEWHYTTER